MSHFRHNEGEVARQSSKDMDDGQRPHQSGRYQENSSHIMEHLATFTVNEDAGIVTPIDGMRRLLQMEKNTGIWSQKMKLCLDKNSVLITDFETGELIERFPYYLIESPTAFTSDDVLELYNNVLVFIVSAGDGVQSEMHIFQSQSISAVHLVEDIKYLLNNSSARTESPTTYSNQAISLRKNEEADFYKNSRELYSTNVGANTESRMFEDIVSEKYEREVNLLNSCFDDIEKFIARLQHTAAAVREIERRKYKKREIGDGLLNLHTRPPTEQEFVDILAKFKLSFNLLSKLKSHIHDPNAPELVHFLFTPLALIVEAARDTYSESQLASNVVEPLLTSDTIQFLMNCVSSKETELWKSLGASWITPAEQWCEREEMGNIRGYNRPSHSMGNEFPLPRSDQYGLADDQQIDYGHLPGTSASSRLNMLSGYKYKHKMSEQRNFDPSIGEEIEVNHVQDGLRTQDQALGGMQIQNISGEDISDNAHSSSQHLGKYKTRHSPMEMDNLNEKWLSQLRMKGAKVVVVCYPRIANNDKELSVVKGEYLEIIDDSRKWWKVRNVNGNVGHIPSTIVAPVYVTSSAHKN
ncbi:epidermal growth factor receptor kinase substrate 8-like protein 2 [Musca vetustissima]|uniref:epidermal growth factor receptor kinase substrate 8-like protein 2 n=1 Tax=Musca vetustissima TaxID=27455 RepID=UPI002AB77C42|nr:epidermal growth factor receptor kinase substrate 8-like protein 2 [Musca vetustissima]